MERRSIGSPRWCPDSGVAADGDGGGARDDAAERRAGALPAEVPEDEAHLGDVVLVRLVHLHFLVLLLLDPPHLAVHHQRARRRPLLLPFLRLLHHHLPDHNLPDRIIISRSDCPFIQKNNLGFLRIRCEGGGEEEIYHLD